MPDYEWINEKGEVKITQSHNTPPDEKGDWKRVYSFGLSSITGAGNSPGRVSAIKK